MLLSYAKGDESPGEMILWHRFGSPISFSFACCSRTMPPKIEAGFFLGYPWHTLGTPLSAQSRPKQNCQLVYPRPGIVVGKLL